MLDLVLFRAHQGGDPETVRESQRRRGASMELVDAIVAADAEWRELQYVLDCARKELSQTGQRHRQLAKKLQHEASATDGASAVHLDTKVQAPSREQRSALAATVAKAQKSAQTAQGKLHSLLLRVGNLVHENAPQTPLPTVPVCCSIDSVIYQRLVAAKLVDPGGSGACGEGRLLLQAWNVHATAFLASRGFRVMTEPPHASSERRAKYEKLRQSRGEPASADGCALDEPLAALHSCSWLLPAELPLHYAYWRPRPTCDLVGGADSLDLCVSVICADDGSCWEVHEELLAAAEALHTQLLQRPMETAEISTAELAHADARTFVVRAACVKPGSSDTMGEVRNEAGPEAERRDVQQRHTVELARVSCEYDYRARRLGVRCGQPQLGKTSKRHAHTVSAVFCCPSACLIALAAANTLPGDDARKVLPEALRRRWLTSLISDTTDGSNGRVTTLHEG